MGCSRLHGTGQFSGKGILIPAEVILLAFIIIYVPIVVSLFDSDSASASASGVELPSTKKETE
jgi:hypothetical protein